MISINYPAFYYTINCAIKFDAHLSIFTYS
ncbi:MAG: hypothetical protein JWR09_1673 [Mucilaginibacter sp.]|nr:hypothetical protein [Mucilaginibacter sp.]